MADHEQAPPAIARSRGGLAQAATGGALALALLAVGVWSARTPIATRFIDDSLAERGVPARYRIAQLGVHGTRLENLVIGDPRHPDLVADWVELATDLGLDGVRLIGARAGQVRLRGRLVEGKLSLGAIDRLLPPPTGKPFALPALDVTLNDARMRLETPAGVIGLRLSGRGGLADGFTGRLALIADQLGSGACRAERLAGTLALSIAQAQPSLQGPVRAGSLACGGAAARGVVAETTVQLDQRLDRWQGTSLVSLDALAHPAAKLRAVSGRIDFDGGLARTHGQLDLRGDALATRQASAAAVQLTGDYHVGRSGAGFDGRMSAQGATLAPAWRAALGQQRAAAAGTPIGPLVARAVSAANAAARRFDVASDVNLVSDAQGFDLGFAHGRLTSASGARATLSGGQGVLISRAGWRLDGLLALSGGGLPEAALKLRQSVPGGALRGTGYVRPYASGDARLALEGLDFTTARGGTRLTSRATLSGPIADGRVEGLVAPLAARWRGGTLLLNPGCTPLAADRLAVARMTLVAPRLTLCAEGPGLVQVTGRRLRGAARIAAPELSGTIGDTPLALAADNARLDLATRAFALSGAKARFGAGEGATLLAFQTLAGTLDKDGAHGDFTGGGAQIGTVPLRLDQSNGDWRFADAVLHAQGGLRVSDRASAALCPENAHFTADGDDRPRFCQLQARGVTLSLADNRITASGTLQTPGAGVRVAEVTLTHDLGKASGHAELSVPGVAFGPTLQPDALTPLTYGVISAVNGTVRGEGQLSWHGDKVISAGTFRTQGASLAAAFGPVQGLSGEVHFTDLLKLESAPGQRVTIASVNPGVPVTGGEVRYQTLEGERVHIEGGRWPFAGGALVLDPTTLDFAERAERRLTFHVEGVDAAQFLQSFDFKNLNATGVVDGTLPMLFDAQGGRIIDGHLKMRPGGGTIAYVGELSQRDLGFWGNLAFQSLKSLAYRELEVTMNGPLEGEMITEIRFAGVRQGKGAKSNFLIRRLQRLPILFNVRVQAPFRQLLGSVADLYDPSRLVERNLNQLIEAQPGAPVQPPASGTVPQGEPK